MVHFSSGDREPIGEDHDRALQAGGGEGRKAGGRRGGLRRGRRGAARGRGR